MKLWRAKLGRLKPGDRINLEFSLRLIQRWAAILLQADVDSAGKIRSRENIGRHAEI